MISLLSLEKELRTHSQVARSPQKAAIVFKWNTERQYTKAQGCGCRELPPRSSSVVCDQPLFLTCKWQEIRPGMSNRLWPPELGPPSLRQASKVFLGLPKSSDSNMAPL